MQASTEWRRQRRYGVAPAWTERRRCCSLPGLPAVLGPRTLADGVGFEPTRRLPACRFSRPVPSTTRPPIQRSTLPRPLRGRHLADPIATSAMAQCWRSPGMASPAMKTNPECAHASNGSRPDWTAAPNGACPHMAVAKPTEVGDAVQGRVGATSRAAVMPNRSIAAPQCRSATPASAPECGGLPATPA